MIKVGLGSNSKWCHACDEVVPSYLIHLRRNTAFSLCYLCFEELTSGMNRRDWERPKKGD